MASLELRNGIWHIRYRDKRGKDRSKTTKLHQSPKNDALALKKLQSFEVDLRRGQEPDRSLKIDVLLDMVLTDFDVNRKKSKKHAKLRIEKHLRPWFGELQAFKCGANDFKEYASARRAAGAANGTINRELAILRRAFSLGREAEKLETVPYFPKLKESNPRAGFLERDDMERLCLHVPKYLAPVVRFAFITGWRLSEIRQLQWRHVNFVTGEVRLDPGTTKNGEGRVFRMTAELRGLLEAIRPTRVAEHELPQPGLKGVDSKTVTAFTPLVFIRKTKAGGVLPLGDFRKEWAKAIKAAGLPHTEELETGRIIPGIIFHDLRRSAIRVMVRKGVPERVAMELSGHKTRDVFERYNIVSEGDLERARVLLEGAQSVCKEEIAPEERTALSAKLKS